MASAAGVAATLIDMALKRENLGLNGLCGRCRCDLFTLLPMIIVIVSMASAAGVAATRSFGVHPVLEESKWPLRPVSLRLYGSFIALWILCLNGLCGRCRCDKLEPTIKNSKSLNKSKDTHNSEISYSIPANFPTNIASCSADAGRMTQPRAQLVPPDSDGLYHCVQRCVRRAFLCGVDRYTGQSFEHRKAWVEERLRLLSQCFAVSIHAYAVMSNHLHLVVQLRPDAVAGWSDDDIAARWVRLFPPREGSEAAVAAKCSRLLADSERMQSIRGRLSNLSWLMRCLAEPIARRANREDVCKGRFWEGRFKAQRLCGERAMLAAMAYVDLNPVRAGIAQNLKDSAHTSVAARKR